jgi:hypothetical protein
VSKQTSAHFQRGLDIMAPPTSGQEDGFSNKVALSELQAHSPFLSRSNRTRTLQTQRSNV